MRAVSMLLLLLACAAGLKVDTKADAKERPIAKVVRLLEDMSAQLKQEAEEDEEAYEQMVCWCETNEKEKTKAITLAEARIDGLGSSIEEYKAKAQQLKTDVESLTEQVTEQSDALSKATEIRDKELAEFVAEEKDMIQSITSLKGAVVTLGKAHSEVQSSESLMQVRSMLERHAAKNRWSSHRLVLNLLQQQAKTRAHTPASGEIFGMLKQMKESFETNLASSQKDEEQAATEYSQMKEAKSAEIAAAKNQMDNKKVEMADTVEAAAQAEQDLKDTTAAKIADEEFLADMRPTCEKAGAEYDARVKVRTEEIEAVSQTIGILTSDEANDSFTKSMSFVQKRSSSTRARSTRDRAAVLLREAGKKLRKPRLVTLAVSLRLDAFAKVIENIDNTVSALKQEQKDEVTDRDFCIKELNDIDRDTAKYTDQKNDLETKIADLTTSISELTESITELKAEITDTQVGMKKATAVRAAENKDFNMVVQDQRATQAILTKALDKLKSFYEKKALLQDDAEQEPMPEQKTFSKNPGGGGAVAMIEDIVKESKDLEMKALSDEQDATAAYEGYIKDSNKLITANTEDIASKSEAKAKADMAKTQADGDLKETIDSLLKLADMGQEIHGNCDFLLKNFDARQSARTEEMDALNQAKAIFSGMKF